MRRIVLLSLLMAFGVLFAKDGKVIFVIGTVDVQRTNGNWEKVNLNSTVYTGDRIRTRLQSRCEVELPDESTLEIEENTVFEVKEIEQEESKEYSFFLWLGEVTAKFKKIVGANQKREIESPSAVVAVRGTEFTVGVDQGENTRLSVKSGIVDYRSKATGKFVTVVANQSSTIAPGQDPTTPVSTDSGDKDGQQNKGGSDSDSDMFLSLNISKFLFTETSVLSSGISIPGETLPGSQIQAGSNTSFAGTNGRFQVAAAVREGVNVIQINATNGGASASQQVTVNVNTMAPLLTVKKPLNSRFVNSSRYELEGSINDGTPMDQVELRINGQRQGKYAPQSNFRMPVVLREGLNEIQVSAEDQAGNASTITENLILDTVDPQIIIIRPAASGTPIRIPPPTPDLQQPPKSFVVRGRVIDPQPSSGIEKVTLNGIPMQLTANGQFDFNLQLRIGVNELVFIAQDRAGNESRIIRTIVVRR
jgi:hypothetical protein